MLREKETQLRFDGSVWCNLDIALRNIDYIFRQHLQATGLSVIEWYILRALYEQDGQHASQLASEVGRAATSFTPNLDKLQEKGYIERLPDPDDRRAVLIYLTEQAKVEQDDILSLTETLDKQIEAEMLSDEFACFQRAIVALQTMEIN